ncbi:MAG TPA: ABC transporter substrate-binding protein [Dongiaceae bacterium]|nr:ABC transporter substrate-binding protein [Dongiaceae bacterium]
MDKHHIKWKSHLLIFLALTLLLLVPLAASASGPLRVGFFPNMTHAQALVGKERKIFEQKVGGEIAWKAFNAGPSAMEALLAGQLDLVYVGPNPAVNAFMRSKGKSLRIIAGAASGGAALVVPQETTIASAGDLKGKKVAAPELGNTQDVALRHWLKGQGLAIGKDVQVVSTKNPEIFIFFKQRQIAAAWVPEPWLTRLEQEAGGRILVDERSLWPGGKFPTAVLVARTEFLQKNQELVRRFLVAHLEVGEWIGRNPREAKAAINTQLKLLTGKPLPGRLLDDAFSRVLLTHDPLSAETIISAGRAGELGYLPRDNVFPKARVREVFDLTLLNSILRERRLPLVK